MKDVQREIIDAATRSWEDDNKVLLLSALGDLKDGRIARAARDYAGSLKSFIDAEIPQVRIVEHSQIRSLIGVVPSHIADAGDTILEMSRSARRPKLYFKEHFWNAFKNPLDRDKKRFVVPHTNVGSPRVVDIENTDVPPSGRAVSAGVVRLSIRRSEFCHVPSKAGCACA